MLLPARVGVPGRAALRPLLSSSEGGTVQAVGFQDPTGVGGQAAAQEQGAAERVSQPLPSSSPAPPAAPGRARAHLLSEKTLTPFQTDAQAALHPSVSLFVHLSVQWLPGPRAGAGTPSPRCLTMQPVSCSGPEGRGCPVGWAGTVRAWSRLHVDLRIAPRPSLQKQQPPAVCSRGPWQQDPRPN